MKAVVQGGTDETWYDEDNKFYHSNHHLLYISIITHGNEGLHSQRPSGSSVCNSRTNSSGSDLQQS